MCMADIPLSPRRLAYLAGVRRQKRRELAL